jgi:hypothetical protein
MNLARDVDYIAWRQTDESSTAPYTDADAHGSACTPADAKCAEAFVAARPENDEWGFCDILGCSYWGLVSTLDGEVTISDDLEEVVSLLGEIDTAEEAALIADVAAYRVTCGSSTYAITDEGFEIFTRRQTSPCPLTTARFHLLVRRDGTLEVLGQDQVDEQEACI